MNIDEAKRYKLVIGLLILVNVLIIAVWWVFYLNEPNDSDGKRIGQWRTQRRDFMEKTLQLDSLQKMKFKELGDNHMMLLEQLNREIDSLKTAINKEIMVQEGPSERIDSLFRAIAEKRAAVDTSIFHHFKRLRAVCRPDQAVRFDSLMMEFMSRKDRGPRRFNQEQRDKPQGEQRQGPRHGGPVTESPNQ